MFLSVPGENNLAVTGARLMKLLETSFCYSSASFLVSNVFDIGVALLLDLSRQRLAPACLPMSAIPPTSLIPFFRAPIIRGAFWDQKGTRKGKTQGDEIGVKAKLRSAIRLQI